MANEHITLRRRAFLGVVGAAGVAASGCGDDPATPTGPVDVGPTSDWPARTWKILCAQNLLIGRDDDGFYALSAICTHMACTVVLANAACGPGGTGSPSASGTLPELGCACHQSRFNIRDGAPVSGPAPRALPAYQVTVANGRVIVDRGVSVAGTARTAAG